LTPFLDAVLLLVELEEEVVDFLLDFEEGGCGGEVTSTSTSTSTSISGFRDLEDFEEAVEAEAVVVRERLDLRDCITNCVSSQSLEEKKRDRRSGTHFLSAGTITATSDSSSDGAALPRRGGCRGGAGAALEMIEAERVARVLVLGCSILNNEASQCLNT
jgi:hypothetical protein